MTTPSATTAPTATEARYIDEIARLNDELLRRDAMIEVLSQELEATSWGEPTPVNYWPVEELAALVAGDTSELVVSA